MLLVSRPLVTRTGVRGTRMFRFSNGVDVLWKGRGWCRGQGEPTTSRLVAFEDHGTLTTGLEAQCVRYLFVVVCLCAL